MKKEKRPFEFYFITILFTILIAISFLQVLFRFVLNLPLAWTEELSRYVFILLVYSGASAAAREDKHVRIDVIDNVLPSAAKKVLDILVKILCGIACLVITVNIRSMVINSYRANQLSAALRFPMYLMYVLVGVMFLIIAFRFFQRAFIIAKTDKGGGKQ